VKLLRGGQLGVDDFRPQRPSAAEPRCEVLGAVVELLAPISSRRNDIPLAYVAYFMRWPLLAIVFSISENLVACGMGRFPSGGIGMPRPRFRRHLGCWLMVFGFVACFFSGILFERVRAKRELERDEKEMAARAGVEVEAWKKAIEQQRRRFPYRRPSNSTSRF
jgi:hypothetical protein